MREFAAVSPRRRLLAFIAVGALVGLVAGPTGWFVTDALERDNDFCNSCHLTEGVPLHIDTRNEFDSVPAVNLAGVHGAARVESRSRSLGDDGDPAFRCIDCHGGSGLAGRARVKVLAAMDTLMYVTGQFEEPHGMEWPLEEADCRKCHGEFQTKAAEFESPAFHDLPLHNRALGVDCVECHRVHQPGDASYYFLDHQYTREQCARCHSDFRD